MPKENVLVEHSSAINNIISKTFQTTHRIKFTAFDVSSNYIIFGANSGGIYIFTREPCQFVKLIPSTHGPTNLLQISPNEENLAIAVSTGLVIVLEGCFTTNFEQQVFTEHEGSIVTAMKWNGNDLYCGDSLGRISVITLRGFLTMFQTPVACLMQLDSQIVQLDTHSKFLLVSTQTRSVLCDTETERYRQIGKKLRDGYFGACFLNCGLPPDIITSARSWSAFKTLTENEQLSHFANEDVKIYCARPGVRLWQVDFQANVILTHQCKPSLPDKPSDIIQWDDKDELNMIRSQIGTNWENFNLNKIFPLLDRFVVTFRDDGFYIFEPSKSALVHWSTLIRNINDIKIVDSFLYIWHEDMKVSIFALISIEEVILRSLIRKKFNLCGELCLEFFEELELLLPTSKKIHLLSALESKLENEQVLEKLAPIFEYLKNCAKIPNIGKSKNGIVTVNALPILPESVENFEIKKEKNESFSILQEQYKISKIHKTIETKDFIKLMQSLKTQDLYHLLNEFQSDLKCENCDSWCREIFLKYLKLEDLSAELLQYTTQTFLEVNYTENLTCRCNFPLPKAHQNNIKYYELGCHLIEKTNPHNILERVPYLYNFFLKKLENLESNLPLIIQFSDLEILQFYSNKMTYDLWDESTRLLIKLKSNQCLNCGSEIDSTGDLNWTKFGVVMVESIKPTNSIKLLKRYSSHFPKGELAQFFYQYCLINSVVNINQDLKDAVKHESATKQLDTSIGGFLRRKYLNKNDYQTSQSFVELENCDHCQMPLKIQIFNHDVKKLPCGHNYHQVCFLYNQSHCTICKPDL